MRTARLAALAATVLAAAGCSLAPTYTTPPMVTPQAYKEVGPWTPASPADGAPRGDWWTVYGDQTLDGLEQRIETDNPELAAALARYDEARAFAAEDRSALFPEVGAAASSLLRCSGRSRAPPKGRS